MTPASAPASDPVLQAQLLRHEGLRLRPYRDTAGKTTIGVGRNLDDVGLTRAEALALLANDIRRVEDDLDATLPWWRSLDPVRRRVLIDMGFNLGVAKLAGWSVTLALVRAGAYERAADEMLASQPWASQVGARARDLAQMMRTGRQG